MSSASKIKNFSSKPSRKFQNVDTSAPSSISSLQTFSRFSSIDETNDPRGISTISGKDYDTISNISSWSGDSEEIKEKQPAQNISPLQADNEKRERIRLKNEKKHQRQKERRAQELHEKCSSFLISRKLEALSQQLVSMGFSSERATMALILNHGKIEESISWLIKEGEGADKHKEPNLNLGNLKINISEELARISGLEIRYKCSKQDIERAVVACEGDLEKAEELFSKPVASAFIDNKGDGKNINCTKKDVASGALMQDIKKSQPIVELPQRISREPKSEPQNVIPESEYNQNKTLPNSSHLDNFPQNNQYIQQVGNRVPPAANIGTGERRGNSPPISVACSLGLYSRPGSASGSSQLDWNSVGPLLFQLDYTNVDWSLNLGSTRENTTGSWQGGGSRSNRYDPFPSARGGGLREWSSPFEERYIFSLPREFVSPYLSDCGEGMRENYMW